VGDFHGKKIIVSYSASRQGCRRCWRWRCRWTIRVDLLRTLLHMPMAFQTPSQRTKKNGYRNQQAEPHREMVCVHVQTMARLSRLMLASSAESLCALNESVA